MKMWICRSEEGLLTLHYKKPTKFYEECIGYYWTGHSLSLPLNLYPEVTFENSPMEVELKLVNDVQGK